MGEEPTNADLLAAIERLGASVDSRFSSVEKTGKDTNAMVNRIDIRLKSVEATVDEISVTVGVHSKAIGTIKADLEVLEARVEKLENT